MLWDWTFLTYCVLTIFPYFSPSKCDEDNTVWGLLFWIALGGLSYYEGVLWPVHTGDYSRRNRRQIVAEIGDYSLQCGHTQSTVRWPVSANTPGSHFTYS